MHEINRTPFLLTERPSTYDLLKAATNNFSSKSKIASGGWATVYKVVHNFPCPYYMCYRISILG